MLKMVDGTGIIGVDMVCPLGGAVSPPQPPNFDKVEVEGVGSLMLPNSLKVPLERVELIGNSVQGENPAPENPQEIYGSSVSEIKEYLKIHPLHLVYKTEATEFVPLSEFEQTQLRNLHSYNGTTNIMVDSGEVPCGIKLTYRKEK